MANELNLYDTCQKILSKSKVIEGRFVVGSGYSSDLNSDNFGQMFKDALGAIKTPRKYPVCFMFPPVEIVDGYNDPDWTRFKIQLFFLAQPHNGSNGLLKANPLANTSDHTVVQTWKDMTVCAKNFRKAFIHVTERTITTIRDGQTKDVIQRYSKVGNDFVAGVGIEFDVLLFDNCQMDDYTEEELNDITIIQTDLHPHHKY